MRNSGSFVVDSAFKLYPDGLECIRHLNLQEED